jgi:hypothetical protein
LENRHIIPFLSDITRVVEMLGVFQHALYIDLIYAGQFSGGIRENIVLETNRNKLILLD